LVLFCPQCDYNLTGLVEHRCPECGTPFDPERLRVLQARPRRWYSTCIRVVSRFFAAPLLCVALQVFVSWADPRVSKWHPTLNAIETVLLIGVIGVMVHNAAIFATRIIRAPYRMFGNRSYGPFRLAAVIVLVACLCAAQIASYVVFIRLTSSPIQCY